MKAKLQAAASLIALFPWSIEADVKVLHWRARLAQKVRTVEDPGQRQALEESERLRWVMALGEIFERAGLPTAVLATRSLHPRRALQGASGMLRAKTLRCRVRTWWKVREWVYCSTGQWHPPSLGCMLDYVYDVASAGCPPSRLHAIAAALCVVKKRGGVSPGDMESFL